MRSPPSKAGVWPDPLRAGAYRLEIMTSNR